MREYRIITDPIVLASTHAVGPPPMGKEKGGVSICNVCAQVIVKVHVISGVKFWEHHTIL